MLAYFVTYMYSFLRDNLKKNNRHIISNKKNLYAVKERKLRSGSDHRRQIKPFGARRCSKGSEESIGFT